MALTKDSIITLPNEHLRQRSKKIGLVSADVKELVSDMETVILEWEDGRNYEVGVALAAVQVDKLLRLIVVRNSFESKTDRSFTAFINPVITKYEGEVKEDFEGCLSIPDVYGHVPRHNKVRIKAVGLDGREFRVTAEGFLARVFQHEIDHTNGELFIDHIKDNTGAFFKLDAEGHLQALNYEKDIRNSRILW